MSLINRLHHIEMTLEDADENFMEWVRGKSDDELVDIIKRLDREHAMSVNLGKDATTIRENLEVVRMIIERRVLIEMVKDMNINAPASVLDGKTGYTVL